MPDRVANVIVLVEDREQEVLVRRFLQLWWGARYVPGKIRVEPLPAGRGAGEQHVRKNYPKQVQACRSRIGKRTSCLLIVMIDADSVTVDERGRQLSDELRTAGLAARGEADTIALLIPKRHVETWIRALLGSAVSEIGDYKRPAPSPEEIKAAARSLCTALRGPEPPADWPASLITSFPEWHRVPK